MSSVIEKEDVFVSEELLARLKQCNNLPSPPGVAARIIELGQDSTADMGMVADAVSIDPALAAKILRIANSPLYARQRKTENLRQAIMMLGLNGTLTLALSFSLVSTLRSGTGSGLDYNLFWRRSLAAATASRSLGSQINKGSREEHFLAGLLQDIGMLALDRINPELYQQLGPEQSNHAAVQAAERDVLGSDHAAAGAWLLENWKLPRQLTYAVAASHDPTVCIDEEYKPVARCVAASGAIADILWREDHDQASQEAGELVEELLGMDRKALADVLESIAGELRETAALFDINLGDPSVVESILDQAKEILMLRNLQTMQESQDLHKAAESLESRTRELEEETRRDKLTGLFNRAHFDGVIEDEFRSASSHGWPLAVLFIDIDHFKQVNDTYGHQAGDEILRGAARTLMASTRDTDVVARYGGEEFVIILPGTGKQGACVTSDRIVQAFRKTVHDIGQSESVGVTVSVGIAIQGEGAEFAAPGELVGAADGAVYGAKQQGRNRWVLYGSDADNQG